ncbi:Carboxypeptidase [Abortiporus biennis]
MYLTFESCSQIELLMFEYPQGTIDSLNTLSEDQFTSLKHPNFPKYSVRIKKSRGFCDDEADAYTGYVDVEAKHFFFYFFESRHKPDEDDVILWMNGGPGCSGTFGLFMELGPCRVISQNETRFNPYSWTEHANMIFIDQPVGAGFSYADYGEYVSTTDEAADDFASFIAIFFEQFTKFRGRAFHLAGESYGGRFIPVFASRIHDRNAQLAKAGLTPINLKSIMIGNGCTDNMSMLPSYYDLQCLPVSVPPVTDIATCVGIKNILPRCNKWLKESCVDMFDMINCRAAYSWCRAAIGGSFDWNKTNPYDMSKSCEGNLFDDLCYPITKNISSYLNQPQIQRIIGIDPTSPKANFSSCDEKISADFGSNLDSVFPTQLYIEALLHRGVKVLIYVGANDWLCNWVGNERMTLNLQWAGQKEFINEPLKEWSIDVQIVGKFRHHGLLTFVTLDGAGHFAPYDKPITALEIVKRWLK